MYAGMVNTYARRFRQDVAYCSDSNGYWGHERLRDVLARPAQGPLQVLTHPSWWTPEVLSPRQRLVKAMDIQKDAILAMYAGVLAAAGRPDIDD